VAEALLQSHAGEVSLLPALPAGWADGSVTGLRARGGLVVGMRWKDGRLVSAQIRGDSPGAFRVRSGGKTVTVTLPTGRALELNADLVRADEAAGQR
jgi:alpha-L-fucosidase 2